MDAAVATEHDDLTDMTLAWLEQEVLARVLAAAPRPPAPNPPPPPPPPPPAKARDPSAAMEALVEEAILQELLSAASRNLPPADRAFTGPAHQVPTPQSTPRGSPIPAAMPGPAAPFVVAAEPVNTPAASPTPTPPRVPSPVTPVTPTPPRPRTVTPPRQPTLANAAVSPLPDAPHKDARTSPMPQPTPPRLPSPPPPRQITPPPARVPSPPSEETEAIVSEGEIVLESDGEVYPDHVHLREPLRVPGGLAGVRHSDASSDSELEHHDVPLMRGRPRRPHHRDHHHRRRRHPDPVDNFNLDDTNSSGAAGARDRSWGQLAPDAPHMQHHFYDGGATATTPDEETSHVSYGELLSPGQMRRKLPAPFTLDSTDEADTSFISELEPGEQPALASDIE
jgi:hypothetical protein